jgi:hypothetical protein
MGISAGPGRAKRNKQIFKLINGENYPETSFSFN